MESLERGQALPTGSDDRGAAALFAPRLVRCIERAPGEGSLSWHFCVNAHVSVKIAGASPSS